MGGGRGGGEGWEGGGIGSEGNSSRLILFSRRRTSSCVMR